MIVEKFIIRQRERLDSGKIDLYEYGVKLRDVGKETVEINRFTIKRYSVDFNFINRNRR